jgi:glycosyltransferase involved in cell wall biosynthesis
MKVLFVHNFYQQFGGEDSAAIAERNLLESNGDEVLCFTRHNDEIKSYSVWDRAAFIPRTMYSHRTEREITQAVENFKPQVAFVHNVYPLISPSLYHSLYAMKVPIVQVVHDFRPFCPNGWFYVDGQICERCKFGNYLHAVRHRCYKDSYLLSALYSATLAGNRMAGMTDKVAAFVCLTNFYKQKMLEVGIPEKKIFIRPNFIDPAAFAPDRPTPGSGEYALYLGRLSSEKGPLTVLRAFEQLRDVPLKIVGTGPMEVEMKQFIRDRKLDHVEMVGFKSGEEKWRMIKNALFTIIPSECYENFPMVSLEYFSGGKPVIASNLGGLPHIVEDGKTGLLYRPGDATDLVEKVRFLLSQPARIAEMGMRGRQLAETRYGPQESYSNLMGIFQRVQVG